jgi:LacI family transcriptional regulator
MLASQKKHTIYCIIPEYTAGDFWSLTAKGIEDAKENAQRYGVSVETVTYDQYDLASFQKACMQVLDLSPSGVVIAPLFKDETLSFVRELSARGVSYIYIDSRIEEDEDYFAYFGLPMFQSGYLCADILVNGADISKVYVIRIERDKKGQSDPTYSRRRGFMEYMSENNPSTEIENVFIDPRNPDDIARRLDNAFGDTDCRNLNIVMFNSRVHLIADYLKRKQIKGARVVGFDFLEKNVNALRDGLVHALIAQHSDRQVAMAIQAMTDHLVLSAPVQKKDHFNQMDIINRYNCDYYM